MPADIWKTTACPYDCPDACAMKGRFDGERVTLEPNPLLPWSAFLCEKGRRWAHRAVSPQRLRTPLLRTGGTLEPVSWNEALDTWAERIRAALGRSGPLSIFFLSSAGSLYFSKLLIPHFFAALGGYTTKKGNLCSSAGSFGLAESFGAVPVSRPETLADHARGVLFWGRNALETHSHGVPLLKKVRERGGEIAVLEIRSTPTTKFADRWWRVNPGSDWALAAWLCRRILAGGHAASGWAERVTNKEEFRTSLEKLDDGALLYASGVSAESGQEILNWLLRFAPVTHYPAFGAQRYFHGDGQFRWIGALSVLLGAFDGPGGGVVFSKDEMALFPDFLRPVQKNVRRLPVGTWPLELKRLTPPVEVAAVSGADPLRQNPGSSAVRTAWQDIPFTVCADFVLSDTAAASDLVLPVTTFLEEEGDWKGSYWHSCLVRSERVLPPRGEALEELEIYTRLARRLGLPCDLLALKGEMDRAMLANPALEPLGEGIYRWKEPEFWSDPKNRATLPAETPEVKVGPAGSLRLVTVHKREYINGQSWDAPGVPSRPVLSLHPADGEFRGVAHGARVHARRAGGSEEESLLVTLAFDPSVGRGYCILPQGTRGVNLLTEPLASPGWGAPFAESWITLAPEETGTAFSPSEKR